MTDVPRDVLEKVIADMEASNKLLASLGPDYGGLNLQIASQMQNNDVALDLIRPYLSEDAGTLKEKIRQADMAEDYISMNELEDELSALSRQPVEQGKALEELVAASEKAYLCNPDNDDDNEDVASPGLGITFGMVRRARAELSALQSPPPDERPCPRCNYPEPLKSEVSKPIPFQPDERIEGLDEVMEIVDYRIKIRDREKDRVSLPLDAVIALRKAARAHSRRQNQEGNDEQTG